MRVTFTLAVRWKNEKFLFAMVWVSCVEEWGRIIFWHITACFRLSFTSIVQQKTHSVLMLEQYVGTCAWKYRILVLCFARQFGVDFRNVWHHTTQHCDLAERVFNYQCTHMLIPFEMELIKSSDSMDDAGEHNRQTWEQKYHSQKQTIGDNKQTRWFSEVYEK